MEMRRNKTACAAHHMESESRGKHLVLQGRKITASKEKKRKNMSNFINHI